MQCIHGKTVQFPNQCGMERIGTCGALTLLIDIEQIFFAQEKLIQSHRRKEPTNINHADTSSLQTSSQK